MSNYRPPYSSQSYNNFPPPPAGTGYAPQPQPQPQYQHQQYAAYPQQAPPGYYTANAPPTYAHGPHTGYTPANPGGPPAPGARGLEFNPSFSAPPPPAPHLKYPLVQAQDASQPQQQQPPPGDPSAMYANWQQRQMPGATRQFSERDARGAATGTFDRFDVDRSGYLDLQEFMDALRALHLSITYHQALECFIRCDANEDGRIGKEEFVNVYIDEMNKREQMSNMEQRPPGPPPPGPAGY